MSDNSKPLEAYCEMSRPPGACGLVIFGASGDLTQRKLIPSLFHLFSRGLMPERFFVMGFARTPMASEDFRARMEEILQKQFPASTVEARRRFLGHCEYQAGGYDQAEDFKALRESLEDADRRQGVGGSRIFYLSTPPSVYGTVVTLLGQAGLIHPPGASAWTRVILEKPFGLNLAGAQALDAEITRTLSEQQIYRMDHYLGKETVQNLLAFRFANRIFEPVWNRDYVDHVQITVAETLGVEKRGGYYDQTGVIPDMFQNHLFQVMTLMAMEQPSSFTPEAMYEQKRRVIRSVRPFPEDLKGWVVRGQYGPGTMKDQAVPGYRQEKGVNPESKIETFAAMKLMVDNPRWEGVPFYLRCGKRLGRKVSEVAVCFKRPAHSMFSPGHPEWLDPNVLAFNLQPEESFSLVLHAKRPGPKMCTSPVVMDFCYRHAYGSGLPEAYEQLLLDVMNGDQTLYIPGDVMELSWTIFDPLMARWRKEGAEAPPLYPSGSWGPAEANLLMEQDGRRWRLMDDEALEGRCTYQCPGCKAREGSG